MGGCGASSGGRYRKDGTYIPYGSEYKTLLKSGNIKFVRYNDSKSAKTPMETMTKGRVYVTVNSQNQLVAFTYYDTKNKRTKQIDLTHEHESKKPHTHEGYIHDERGTHRVTTEEKAMVERVQKIWYNQRSK